MRPSLIGDQKKPGAGDGSSRSDHAGIPADHRRSPFIVEYSGTNLQEMMTAALGPAHLLLFHKPPAHDLIDGRLRKSRRDRLVVAPAIAVVRDERPVRVDVVAELTHMRKSFGLLSAPCGIDMSS